MAPQLTGLGSAHVMGGCRLAGKEELGVVRPDGVHWQVENLSVHDGSLFPTSIGANPQLSVYGTTNRLSSGLIKRLAGARDHWVLAGTPQCVADEIQTGFARTGDPGIGWPAYTTGDRKVLVINDPDRVVTDPDAQRRQAWSKAHAEVGS